MIQKPCIYKILHLEATTTTLHTTHKSVAESRMALQFLLLTVLLQILVPVLAVLLLNKSRENKPRDGDLHLPPGPQKLPIIGHLHLLGKLPHRSLQKLSQIYGPVIQLWLGGVPTVVVSSAEAAKEVMKTHDLHCCSRPPSPGPKRLSYGYVDVAFAPYNEYWREMRKLFILELLSMRRVQSFAYAREAQVIRLINTLKESDSTPVNLNEKTFAFADGIIGTVAFGKIYGTDHFKNREFQQVLDEAMNMLAGFAAEDFWPSAAGRIVDKLTGMAARREKSFQELDEFFEMVLQQHLDPARSVEVEQEDLVDVLINLWREQETSLKLTKDHLKAMLMDTFIGGIDTSSITMLWAMSELIRNPRVMKKVQEEIRSVIGNNKEKVEADDVVNLDYLKMVVKETFRLHPPATLLSPRETMSQVKIGGFDVPAKTRIYVNAWAIGRDPLSWKNPEEFYPERFEGSGIDFKGAHFELVPFGAGRRICPGLTMGATNVEFALANLLYCFNWELPNGKTREDVSMEEDGGLTFRRKNPLQLVPKMFTPQV